MVLSDRCFEAMARRAVVIACIAVKDLKFLSKAGKIATLRLDEPVAGGITNFRQADKKLTDRGLSTEGCSFSRHVMG
jgi:hypothetical protein